jgi:hypothetical protein
VAKLPENGSNHACSLSNRKVQLTLSHSILRQLGIFHQPQSESGRISILVTHPATIARALARKLLRG